jgi:hypothetical protein
MRPMGEGPLTKQIIALSGGEKKAKTHIKSTPNGTKLYKTHLQAQGKQSAEDGARWPLNLRVLSAFVFAPGSCTNMH